MATVARRAEKAVEGRPLHIRLLSSERGLGYLLLIPTLTLLVVFLAYPFLFGLWLSLSSAELTDLGHFIGLSNYKFELTVDKPFMQALTNTFLYTGVTTVFKLTLGMSMALLLNQVFPFQRFVRAALLLPWIIPTVLSTLAWKWMFDPTFSVVNWAAVHLHLVSFPGPNWFGNTGTALTALMIVNTWRGTPFYAIAFLAGLQTIPVDLYEAARVDGARRWH
ncbi:MAG TPA: sugar ABC transporter permease, partial [Candidatus Dormibacteraeota bacterium]|nr:sugar ABC transporter permease [Candidatus Dormibacteraeota bacterium]